MRMARLDHERLRHTCSLKWVKDRKTDVNYEEVIRTCQLRDDMAAIFRESSIVKRLNGEVKIQRTDFDDTNHVDD